MDTRTDADGATMELQIAALECAPAASDGAPVAASGAAETPGGLSSTESEALLHSRVMLVDDEQSNLVLLREILRRANLTNLSGFSNSTEALEAVARVTPDLILLDIRMPGIDGYGFLTALRERMPSEEMPPVLMMTGDTSPGMKLRSLDLGATDFVAKPFDASELLLRIRNALRTRELQTRIRAQNQQLEITVQQRTRELQDALFRAESAGRAKEAFLAKMSHELRTPLTPLVGALEMLAEDGPPDGRGLIDLASRSANRLRRLIDDILLLQRLEQNVVSPDIVPVRVVRVVRGVLASLSEASARDIELEFAETDEQLTLLSDESFIEDIVRRIVQNAVQFSPPGSAVIVGIEAAEAGSGLAITVADEGPGIPKDRIETIFAAFEQVDNSSSRPHEGAGLGLSISRRLCEILRGTLTVSVRPGGGTIFRIGLASLDRRRPAA